jgi:regulator of replication initiation timing
MELGTFDIINIITPVLTLVGGWLFGRRKQKNDFLSDLQSSIDLLAEKNRVQMEEILKLRDEIVALRKENTMLRKEVEELNGRLENVKTNTRKA